MCLKKTKTAGKYHSKTNDITYRLYCQSGKTVAAHVRAPPEWERECVPTTAECKQWCNPQTYHYIIGLIHTGGKITTSAPTALPQHLQLSNHQYHWWLVGRPLPNVQSHLCVCQK